MYFLDDELEDVVVADGLIFYTTRGSARIECVNDDYPSLKSSKPIDLLSGKYRFSDTS